MWILYILSYAPVTMEIPFHLKIEEHGKWIDPMHCYEAWYEASSQFKQGEIAWCEQQGIQVPLPREI